MRLLALLGSPLSSTVIRRLSDGPTPLIELRRASGSPAQTTLRAHLKELDDIGAIARRRRDAFPGVIECELTPAGTELLSVADALERWLQEAPEGPLAFGSSDAKAAIKALMDGWASTMLRALAARPLSLTELDSIIEGLSYPSLERRLGALRLTGQIEACTGNGKGTPYKPTEWLRRATAPLAAAARWERRHILDDSSSTTRADTETSFLLSLPLVRLPAELSGSCRMGVETNADQERRLAGVIADVQKGRIASCTVRLNGSASAWVIGSATAWLHAVVDLDLDGLELGGDRRLARGVVDGLHAALFKRSRARATPKLASTSA